MTDVFLERRSIRKFKKCVVSKEFQTKMVQAGLSAPSSCDRQPWEFIVINDSQILDRLMIACDNRNYNPPMAIAICADKKRYMCWKCEGMNCDDFWVQDCSAAMENILLKATELGLGSVWIGVYPIEKLEESVNKILKLKEGMTTLGIAYIGYSAEEPKEKQLNFAKIHYNTFSE